MTIEEAIKHCEEVAKEQRELFSLCPIPSEMCDPNKDCASLKNGKNKGCIKCAEEHEQLAEWLKELKSLKEKDEQATEKEAWKPLPKPYSEKQSNKVGWSSLENVREKVGRTIQGRK